MPEASLSGGAGGPEAVLGIVTVSDRASAGQYEDLSGPAVLKFFQEAIQSRQGLLLADRVAAQALCMLRSSICAAGELCTKSYPTSVPS